MSKLVSIVIPVYNRINLVKEMINSIVLQTYTEWELLLIDDGSENETIDGLIELTQKDNRIYFYQRERLPKGAPTCRNIGLEKSKGEYIIFLDSDDLLSPIMLEQRVKFMEDNEDKDFGIFPSISFIKELGENNAWYKGVKICNDDLKFLIDSYLPFLVVTNIYRRKSLIDKNIFWNENLLSFQDVEFNINNIIKRNLYKYSCNAYFDYYIRVIPQSNSISQSIKTSLHQNSHIYFIDNLYNILPHEIKQKYKWAIRRRIAYIYTTINANNKIDPCNFEKLKSIVLKNDKLFYPYFITSAKIYNFLHKIKMPKAGHLTFPYYFIYQTVIGRFLSYNATKKAKDIKFIDNIN